MDAGVRNERRYRVADSAFHHALAPLAIVDSAYWGDRFYPVRTNSLGFKDASARVVRGGSTPAVVFMGDSFTEGIGVPFDSTFVGRLGSDAWRRGVQVLNAGVASYSPVIYWRRLMQLVERKHLKIDEIVVFVDISDIQDETEYFLDGDTAVRSPLNPGITARVMLGALQPSGKGAGFARDWWRLHSLVVYPAVRAVVRPFVRPSSDSTCGRAESERGINCRAAWTVSPEARRQYGTRGLAAAEEHMSALSAYARARGIPLTVAVYPWMMQLRWNDRRSLQSRAWEKWARERQNVFVDLFPPFFDLADSIGTERSIALLNIPGDVHWNERGHAFVASRFQTAYCAAVPSAVSPRPLARAIC